MTLHSSQSFLNLCFLSASSKNYPLNHATKVAYLHAITLKCKCYDFSDTARRVLVKTWCKGTPTSRTFVWKHVMSQFECAL